MLALLRSCASGKPVAKQMQEVLALPGTHLIIQQQNISRLITVEQYRKALESACLGSKIHVAPADAGLRAQKGAAGLENDVIPSLIWGKEHISLLEGRLERLRRNRSIGEAIPLAQKYLPQPVDLSPRYYFVMGGRAGAAAFDNEMYMDILCLSWRSFRDKTAWNDTDVVEFFAHETHHIGYGRILEKKKLSLSFTPGETQTWNLLTAIVMEGSATLLINGHEKLSDLEKQSHIQPDLDHVLELLPAMQNAFNRSLGGELSAEDYAKAVAIFFERGEGYHAAGAVLLNAIEQKRGLPAVMDVLADPRKLLLVYNECMTSSTVRFEFDPDLARRMARMGERH